MSRVTASFLIFCLAGCRFCTAAFIGYRSVVSPRKPPQALFLQDSNLRESPSISTELNENAAPSSVDSDGRRAAFSKLVSVAASAAVLANPSPAKAATAGDNIWTVSKPSLEQDDTGTYSDKFVNLLTRFLVNYDDSLRSWWISRAEYVIVTPSSDATAEIIQQREKQFESLETSVEAGLQSRGGKFEGPKGAEELLRDLLQRYGKKGPLAAKQLCGIFALLSVDDQPTVLIAQQLERENAANENEPNSISVAPVPPIVLSVDRKLVEIPPKLEPRRPEESVGPFEVNTSTVRFVSFRSSSNKSLLEPLVSRERTLDPAIYARFFASGALACGFAHAALTPVDVIKTRLQTQPKKYSDGPIVAASQIFKEEGAGAFASGLGPTAAGYFLAGSIAFGGTEVLKRLSVDVLGPQFVLSNPFLVVLGCGAIAVATCDVVLAPFEAARIRLVDDPSFAPSLPATLTRLAKDEGGLGEIYKSLPALLIKDVPFHATKFAAFDAISTAFRSSTYIMDVLTPGAVTIVAGMLAGIAAAVISQPADATFTRCNQPSENNGSKLSPTDAFADLLEKGGIGSGLSSRCVFGAGLVALQFSLYDAAKTTFHVASGDLSLFLDAFGGLSLGS